MDQDSRKHLHVVVLAGGISDERDVSISSGKNVVTALTDYGYTNVDMLDPASETFLDDLRQGEYDVAFIALHGKGGEDGMIQSVLEFLHIPYTGSGVIASACAADKDVSKALYEHAGIPIARGMVVKQGETIDVEAIVAKLGSNLFVKPALNGSSYGVTPVHSARELPRALEVAFEHSAKALIEERLVGTEITVGVFEGKTLKALPIVEIRKQAETEFYDLNVKYSDPSNIHRIPAEISKEDYKKAQQLAVLAHQTLGCRGFSRSDFIVTDRGPVILETNTIPGMTDRSLYPDEVRHTDMTFGDVCDRLVALAVDE